MFLINLLYNELILPTTQYWILLLNQKLNSLGPDTMQMLIYFLLKSTINYFP